MVQVNKLEDNIQSLAKKPDIQMSDLLLKVWGSCTYFVDDPSDQNHDAVMCAESFQDVSGSQQHEEEMSWESSCLTRQGHSRAAALDTPFPGSCRYACPAAMRAVYGT